MRVTIVTETYPPEVNGVALTVQSLARGLAALGHAVELVRPRQQAASDAAAGDDFRQLLVAGSALPGYPGLRFGLPAQRRLCGHWSVDRPDVLYVATEGPLGVTALSAARKLGIPACTGFHTRFDDFARHYGLGWLTPIVFAYLRRFHNGGSATVVATSQLAHYLNGRGFRHVRLVRRAVDTQAFAPHRRCDRLRAEWGLEKGDLAVIHVGRVANEKNLDLAVRAFRAISNGHPRARFILVGDGPARARLAAEHPDILFCGVRRDGDLSRHYASADLFLFPSETETFGNVTLEALASGVPVIAFDYAAAREHINGALAGTRVERGNGDAFIAAALAACRALSEHPDLAQSPMRAAARHAVATLDPASVALRFSELLGSLSLRRVA